MSPEFQINAAQDGIENYWQTRGQDWDLNQVGNQLEVGDFGRTGDDAWYIDTFNEANEYSGGSNRQVYGVAAKPSQHSDDFSTDTYNGGNGSYKLPANRRAHGGNRGG